MESSANSKPCNNANFIRVNFQSGQPLCDDFPVNVREPSGAALETEGELLVVQPGQMQNRRVQIVNVRAVFHGVNPRGAKFSRAVCRQAATLIR